MMKGARRAAAKQVAAKRSEVKAALKPIAQKMTIKPASSKVEVMKAMKPKATPTATRRRR